MRITVIIMNDKIGIEVLSIMLLIFYLFGRFLTKNACRTICNGKWKKIKKTVHPTNIWEWITFSYFLRQKTKYPYIMEFMVIAINFEILNSILCVLLFIINYNRYIIIWCVVWCVHLTILTTLFRKYVR